VNCLLIGIDSVAQSAGRLSTGSGAGSRAEARGLLRVNMYVFPIRGLVARAVKPCALGFGCEMKLRELVAWGGNVRATVGTFCVVMGQDFVSQHYRRY